ncbi:hypothetical protein [Pseudoscardovia suis]
MKYLYNENAVKRALKISDFRHLSKDKVMQFASQLPYMNEKVALACIAQFPNYADMAKAMIEQLDKNCEAALQSNNQSQNQVIKSYQIVLESLSNQIKDENLSSEEKRYINEKMIEVADKIKEADDANKNFLEKINRNKAVVAIFFGALGAGILGVVVKNKNILPENDDGED